MLMRRGTIGFANNHKIWRDTFIYDQGKLSSKKLDYRHDYGSFKVLHMNVGHVTIFEKNQIRDRQISPYIKSSNI